MYRKKRKKFIEDFNNILPIFKNNLPIQINNDNKQLNTNSWFNINELSVNKVNNNFQYKTHSPKTIINCIKIKMLLNDNQKEIINNWMFAYTDMYNKTLHYIRNNSNFYRDYIITNKLTKLDKNYYNSYYLRDKMKSIRNMIIKKSQLKNYNYDTKIHTHTLDYSIRQLSANLKSAITYLKNKNFKYFKIKYWKHNRPSKTIEIEKQYILNNEICPKI